MDEPYWIIEHREAKPCPIYVQDRGAFYTCDPRKAKHFPIKEEAEGWMECLHLAKPWEAIHIGRALGGGKGIGMKIFLICPVRGASDAETAAILTYVHGMEFDGYTVYWPARDTHQADPIGLTICRDNCAAIRGASEVHVWWNTSSQGSLFDLGMAFAMGKPIFLANPDGIEPTDGKSFTNLLLTLDANSKAARK